MFNKKTIALLEREIDKADGKIKELERGIEFRDGQIKRLVRQIAKMDEKQKELEAENKKLWDMYYASEKVRKRLAGERDVEDGPGQPLLHECNSPPAVPYITVTVPRGGAVDEDERVSADT